MLFKRNLLETITLVSSGGVLLCVFLNYVTDISPITGVWFLVYILSLSIVVLLRSISCIQRLLHLNKPIKYDVEGWLKKYPWLWFLEEILPKKRVREKDECREYDTNELSVISTVLERKLVSSWYIPYISEEIGFPFACKQLLDQMINKTFQICHKIETKNVYVDMCAITITHLKEYKKALKRHENSPTSTVDSLYKKTHSIFDPEKKLSSADHCVNILRIILKELVPWELWDTPHSELLIRVLAKKLDHFIDNTLSDPQWLNDKLFVILEKQKQETVAKETETHNVETEVVREESVVKEEAVKEAAAPSPPETDCLVPDVKPVHPLTHVMKEAQVVEEVNGVVEQALGGSEPVEIKPTAVLRQRRGRQGRNEVKIYDRIIEGSVKTWETDMDLQCISVGQDLLASLDEMTLSRLWGQEDAEHSPNLRNRSPQPLWFGEEDSIDIEQPEADGKEGQKDSAKATEALLKDLQSTVHHAKSKIGDLQVPLDIDVPCKHSSDEAAGVMEGLLDMGRAGLRRGLRLTGLGDDSQEKSPSHRDKGGDKTSSPPDSARSSKATSEPREIPPPAHQREESAGAAPPLLKQHRVISQDSVPPPPRAAPPPDSPEPQYEEAADLSASIAKLRSLLQETGNASSTHMPEDGWWERAEEARGRPQRAPRAARPVDPAALADEYDMSGEPGSSPRQASNNMQRLDRLFQRTVTGVFNSIKTAVGAEEELQQPAAAWSFAAAAGAEHAVGGAVGRLLGARRAAWHVDAALDSLQQLAPPARRARPPPPDDFEEWCAGPGAAWSGGCDAASAAGLPRRHVPCRLAALLLADLGESLISEWLDELASWLRARVFVLFEQMSAREAEPDLAGVALRRFDPRETCDLLLERIPLLYCFGESAAAEAVRLVVASFGHREVNRDVALRALDLLAGHYRRAAALRNPSFDNM